MLLPTSITGLFVRFGEPIVPCAVQIRQSGATSVRSLPRLPALRQAVPSIELP